jgi:hypothetical protein
MHADAAAGGDKHVSVMQGVSDLPEAVKGSRRWHINFGGRLHAERLMRPFAIEFVQEAVELSLLLEAIHARRSGCFLFQGQVHPLVPPILLRMTGFDALNGDAKPEPPDASFERLKRAFGLAKGTPLSERMASGRPRSRKSRSNAVKASSSRVLSRASQSSRKREAWSVTVRG